MLSVDAAGGKDLKRPVPLMMVMNAADGLRIYGERGYAVVSIK